MAKRFIGDSNSSNRLKGVTDGVAIPAGYVGEIQEVTSTTGTILSTTAGTLTDVGLSLTLTAGIWDIEAYICIGYVVTAGTGNVGRNGFIAITDNSNNVLRGAVGGFCNQSTSTQNSWLSVKLRINVSSTTTYKVRGGTLENTTASTAITVTTTASSTYPGVFRAVRIA